ncbi:Short-chain dehydrogenase/reductase SDR [Trypanosoma melophagium]|uniref:Short-chain dehydrogenase/reductase SDR n=1 Tax=Trypanosoma melophagium TaxID=715481 RepID=UPI003519EAA1|nr:Short-chain dehydrogenase/reductase SDR [Trypanosoma melophagium]
MLSLLFSISFFYLCGIIVVVGVLCVAWWSVHRVPPMELKGCCALVTGGSLGIGFEIARELTRCGAKTVIITARREETLRQAATTLMAGEHNTRVWPVVMDVADANSVETAMQTIHTILHGETANQTETIDGRKRVDIDLLICNAGFAVPARFLDTTPEEARRLLDVNLFGAIHLVRAVLPSMLNRRCGRIVLVSSMAARCPIAGYTVYAAAKAAVRAFGHALDMEASPFGVRCQVVSPPDVDTPGLHTENLRKCPECTAVAESGGNAPISANSVAQRVVANIKHYTFDTCIGLDAVLMGWGSAGMEPATSVATLLAQVLLSGWLRLAMAAYSKLHYGIVRRVRRAETQKGAKKVS